MTARRSHDHPGAPRGGAAFPLPLGYLRLSPAGKGLQTGDEHPLVFHEAANSWMTGPEDSHLMHAPLIQATGWRTATWTEALHHGCNHTYMRIMSKEQSVAGFRPGQAQPSTASPTATDVASRRHRGDIISAEKRSVVMARIRGKDTGPERTVGLMLARGGFFHETQARDLPGRPDFVMRDVRLVVLVDGDFWHGWQFSLWRDKLSPKWEEKIAQNRKRDARNIRLLRRDNWKVVKLWEHQIAADPEGCAFRIKKAWFGQLRAAGLQECLHPSGGNPGPPLAF